MAILAIILTFIVPAVGGMLRASQITNGSNALGAQLDFARQTALARNHSIEVRFYRYGDSSYAGEDPNVQTTGKYRAVQIFDVSDAGLLTPLGKVEHLPSTVIIDSGSTLSSVMGTPSTGALAPVSATGLTLNVPIPSAALNYNAVSFRFLPDGSTNLLASSRWYLTIHSLVDGDGLAKAPKNFATIGIDAANGHLRTFRP